MVRTYMFAGLTLVALCETLAGCGFDQSPSGTANGASPCVEGQTAKCDCVGVVAECQSDGTMGLCDCSGASSTGDAGDSADGMAATGKGTGGKSGGGTGGVGADATGGVGDDGAGGVGGDGAGGVGGDGAGGVGGDGAGGTGGDGAGGTGGMKPDPVAVPAGPYGACLANKDCKSPLTCTQLAILQPNKPGYCAQSCTPSGLGATPTECLQPKSGDVQATCASANGLIYQCTLGSCQDKKCPDGMQCTQTVTLIGMVSTCGYKAN